MRKPPRSARPRPHFIWQGALIVLPALLLAAACLYSLRQDKVLAEHELTQQAQRLATVFAGELIPRALQFELPSTASVAQTRTLPEDDPILRTRHSPAIQSAFLVGQNGQLLYPPAFGSIPVPSPLDLGELAPNQQDAWLAMLGAWKEKENVAKALIRFAATEPSERVLALARFRTAMILHEKDGDAEALKLMQMASQASESIRAESGVRLSSLADLKLVHWQPEAQRETTVHRLAAELIRAPSPMADAMWERMPQDDPAVGRWLKVKAAHELSRKQYHEWGTPASPGSSTLNADETEWRMERIVEEGRWVLGISLGSLQRSLAELERTLLKPDHLSVCTNIDGHPLASAEPNWTRLASANEDEFHSRVEVFLNDPAAFRAERNARTIRFVALVAMAAVAVLAGFFSAWRSFRREQQLGEMKTNFVSSVSHELRAPIASVRLMAEELEHGETPGPQKLQQYHRFIGQECRRLSAVIENVLDFARREQGREHFEFDATDLETLVRDTAALMRPYAAEADVRLEEVYLGEAREAQADGHALQRALVNLVHNAIKHSPPKSAAIVGLEFAPDRVFLYVEDSGPGIPREERERIFQRFYRIGSELRRETQGIGLGLSIVKHVAQVHGGRVLLRSEVGHGSRFTIELPLAPAALPLPAEVTL